jgi:hypothetical protein
MLFDGFLKHSIVGDVDADATEKTVGGLRQTTRGAEWVVALRFGAPTS